MTSPIIKNTKENKNTVIVHLFNLQEEKKIIPIALIEAVMITQVREEKRVDTTDIEVVAALTINIMIISIAIQDNIGMIEKIEDIEIEILKIEKIAEMKELKDLIGLIELMIEDLLEMIKKKEKMIEIKSITKMTSWINIETVIKIVEKTKKEMIGERVIKKNMIKLRRANLINLK